MSANVSIAGVVFSMLLLTTGCTTMTETKIRDLNRMADNALAKTVLEQPGLQAELGTAAGYIAIERSGSGVPMVGKRGIGVLVDRATDKRSYITVTRLEVEGAWGVGDYTGIMTIKDAESVKLAKSEGLTLENSGHIYIYVEGEASARYPLKVITLEPKSK